MSYPEQRFRHRQDGTCHVGAHPNWGATHLGASPYTMADSGCLTEDLAYIASRFFGKDITAGELCDWLNANDGYTDANYPQGPGLLKWAKFTEWSKGLLVRSGRFDKTYTIIGVLIGRTLHFVTDLRGGYAKDPLSGDIVLMKDMLASRKWKATNERRYIKAMRKPAT